MEIDLRFATQINFHHLRNLIYSPAGKTTLKHTLADSLQFSEKLAMNTFKLH